MARKRGIDRRVRKTKSLLHEALASLIHEKSYDEIVVKEILARADVGRSTFYSHFRDKDELLDSGVREMLRVGETALPARSAHPADHVLRFSLPLFRHIARYRETNPSVTPERLTIVHDRLELELAALIAADLEQLRQGDSSSRARVEVPSELAARYIASTFIIVLNWWLQRPLPTPSTKADELFRALVLPTLTKAFG